MVKDKIKQAHTSEKSKPDRRNEAVHKKNAVSGRPAGWLKKVRLETFFFIFAKKKKKILKLDKIFMERKKEVEKKKKNCGRPTGFNFSHPLDRKQIFFYRQPEFTECRVHP